MRRFAGAFFALAAIAGSMQGCSDDIEVATCVPGRQITCGCPLGSVGVQQCLSNGTFGPCTGCPDGGVTDVDAGPDPVVVCAPADLSGFVAPAYVPPVGYRLGVCTTELLTGFWTACLDESAVPGACAAWSGSSAPAENVACASCLVTPEGASAYGPFVDRAFGTTVNLGGCLDLTGGTAGEQCAESMQALDACLAAACDANCPITDGPSLLARTNCQKAARTGACAAYSAEATACQDALTATPDGGAPPGPGADYSPADCYAWAASPDPVFADIYNAVAPVFCGP